MLATDEPYMNGKLLTQGTHKKNFSPKFPCPYLLQPFKVAYFVGQRRENDAVSEKTPDTKNIHFREENSREILWGDLRLFGLRYSMFSHFYDVYTPLRFFHELL